MKLEATNRLLAQPILKNPIPLTLGRQLCRHHTKMLKQRYIEKHDYGTKNGMSLVWYSYMGDVNFCFLIDDIVVGFIVLRPIKRTGDSSYRDLPDNVEYSVYEIFITPEHRGKKLGTVLYLGALHKLKHMSSDYKIGLDAVRSWKSLEKYGYDVKLWDIFQVKPIKFTWGADDVPVVKGMSMSVSDDLFIFYI